MPSNASWAVRANGALGRSLVDAVPALAKTELPRAIDETLTQRNAPDAGAHLALPSAAGARILQVRILPVAGGVTLLWHDVTERARAEQALKRSEERLALAAEGANDGLWEWDLRSQEFYSRAGGGRWSACPRPPASVVPRNGWTVSMPTTSCRSRRRSRRISPARRTHFQHEHRIRHEDGTYRRFLCRGVAVRGAGRRAGPHRRIADRHDRAGDRAGAAPQRRIPRSADRAVQPRGLRRGARAAPRRVQAAARRQPVRGAVSRPRPLQGRQRQPRPPGRRRAAHGGVASPRVVPAARETRSPGSAETSSRFS